MMDPSGATTWVYDTLSEPSPGGSITNSSNRTLLKMFISYARKKPPRIDVLPFPLGSQAKPTDGFHRLGALGNWLNPAPQVLRTGNRGTLRSLLKYPVSCSKRSPRLSVSRRVSLILSPP